MRGLRGSSPRRLVSVLVALLLTLLVAATSISCSAEAQLLVPVRLPDAPTEPAAPGEAVALRPLVVATDADDIGLATWRTILDRIGTPYDVVLATTQPLDAAGLVRADGVGRYSAILLTSSALLIPDDDGAGFVSALAPEQWDALWDYERTFRVRQVAINASPTASPEDYCLRPQSEGPIGGASVDALLTTAGSAVFDQLRPDAPIPLSNTYVYRTSVAPDCAAEPVLTLDGDVLGVLSTSTDGRERLALTMIMGAGTLSTDLLAFGLVRWATQGVFVGEQRYHLNVDVDDWFIPTLRQAPPGGAPGTFRLTGPEAESLADQQDELRERHPLAAEFELNLAFNGSGLDPTAPPECDGGGPADDLSSYSLCLVDEFRWINHTFSHPEMNSTSYDQSRSQIADNLERAAEAGLPVPSTVLKTPEYSGLGVYSTDPDADRTLTDHGLEGSNAELLRAASDLGVKYLHGNMSFASHRPACFNCGTYHPLQPDLLLVPDWPTSIAFEATTPDEQTAVYNLLYGSGAAAPADLDYRRIIDSEAVVALEHITSGSAFSHTLHQGNLHEYTPGRSLTYDWLDALLDKYDTHFAVPLTSPDWAALAAYVEDRTAHFAQLSDGGDAVWNRPANSLTCDPRRTGSLFVTGLATQGTRSSGQGDYAELYGRDSVSRVALTTGETVTFAVQPRP